ncbi:MAG TPA: YbaK/EbsC family protein [Actinocrinis sp.]|nr:YbaK/EbsC family protein [Actinocrinis sp.]HZU58553.1 YbaK/EbsC family protein [Actinocrinis sp.]
MTVNVVLQPAADHPELLAAPTAKALAEHAATLPLPEIQVGAIDPALADTAAFCAEYGVGLDESANCVVVAAKRAGQTTYAACLVLATTRADINGLARRHLGARKISFAPMDEAVELTGMEYGGITPVGLPADWPILIDAAVAAAPRVVVGSGIRGSKLWLPGLALTLLPGAEVLPGLGMVPGAPATQ